MPALILAKFGFAAALVLIAGLPVSAAEAQHPPHLRQRIGKIIKQFQSVVPQGPLMRAGPRYHPYDYYGERRAVPGSRHRLGPKEIVSSLHKRGFRDIAAPRRRGSIYILEATGPRGERVRLIVNALTGGIDGVRALGSSHRFRLP
jgi:hypothetical protein